MKLTHHSFTDDGEYIFLVEYDSDDAVVEPGQVIAVDPDDSERRGYYLIESVGQNTITARPVDNTTV